MASEEGHIAAFNHWLNDYVRQPGDTAEIVLQKKTWWLFHLLGIPILMIAALAIGTKAGTGVVVMNMIFFLIMIVPMVIFHFHRKNIETFAFLSELLIVVVTSIKVYLMGGMLNAGTPTFVGMLGPIHAMLYPKKNRAVFIFILYLVLMITASFFSSGGLSEFMITHYLIGFLTAVLVIFLTLYYFTTQVDALKQAEKDRVRELDAFKSKFYTHVSHEFRTPLTIILGALDQQKDNPRKWNDYAQNVIRENSHRLLDLTNQLLDLTKLQQKAMPVDLIQNDIVLYLRYLTESFQSLAHANNIRLSFHSDSDEIIMDYDADKIREVLSNLVSNAIKFTNENGRVKVDIKRQYGTYGDLLLLTVEDNGHGISPDMLQRIFDPYFQIPQRTNQNIPGTGIGLALTRELVNLLGGSITVESELEAGSCFTVRLPITNLADEVSIPVSEGITRKENENDVNSNYEIEAHIESRAGKLRLLIIEDNQEVIQYLKFLLGNLYDLIEAHDGAEGMEKALSQMPDLIISDVMMPVMDGISLCDQLKKNFRTSHIPVILLTARSDEISRIQGLQAGADAYLAKPFNREELFIRIDKLIYLRKVLQSRHSIQVLHEQNEAVSGAVQARDKEELFMRRIREILADNLGNENFSMKGLCKQLGMSRTQLYRKFSSLTDTTLHRYFVTLRLVKARELLLKTDLSVSEIAYDTGFKNISHFSRAFNHEFGFSPSQIRADVL